MAEINQKTLLELMDAVPPFMAYVLARDPKTRKWIGLEMLAAESGLPERTIVRIGSKISWKGVKLGVASAFLKACGIGARQTPVMQIRAGHRYMAATLKSQKPFRHLSAPQWKAFERRCLAWKKARAK